MADQFRIFDRAGVCLADSRAIVNRSWQRNREGRADFLISWLDPNCDPYILSSGNYILVENDKLPGWVGVLDTPYDWKRRRLGCNAYSIERVWSWRRGNTGEKLQGSSGVIFQKMLGHVNANEHTIIVPGEIYDHGVQHDFTLLGETMADNLKDFVERVDQDYDFTYAVLGGRLVIYANWYAKIGRKVDYMLEESINISDDQYNYSQQGEVSNDVTAIGQGADTGTRPQANVVDGASRQKYGLREKMLTYNDVKEVGTLKNHALDELNKDKQPENVFEVSVLDVNQAWENTRIGNQMQIRFWSLGYGIRSNISIESMYFSPLAGKVDLTSKEVFDDSTG